MNKRMKLLLCAMVMLCPLLCNAPAKAEGTVLTTAESARAFAEAFFTCPYVGQAPEAFDVTEAGEGWLAAGKTADGSAEITLLFDREGRVNQYDNTRFPLPDIGVEGIYNPGKNLEPEGENENWRTLDTMLRELPGVAYSPDSTLTYAADAAQGVYTMSYNYMERYATVSFEPEMKLWAYGDLSLNATRYADFLTRGEALRVAKDTLMTAYGMTEVEVDALYVSQTRFLAGQGQKVHDAYPCWEIHFSRAEGGKNGAYGVLMDAKTGKALEWNDPETSGNG